MNITNTTANGFTTQIGRKSNYNYRAVTVSPYNICFISSKK